MVMIVRHNIRSDTRSWFDRLAGVQRPVCYSCDIGPEAIYEIEKQNRINQSRWRGRIRSVHFPRKDFDLDTATERRKA